jgi:transposase
MSEASHEVSTNGLVDIKRHPRLARRRSWPEALKRQIVAETQKPGSSVSVVARRHDVNANQLFQWRRELLPTEPADSELMVPVEIMPEPERRQRRRRAERTGFIEIEFAGGATVRVRGEVAPRTLRQVIELLR